MKQEETIYERMLEDRFYLYRPWIPVSKAVEAGAIRGLELRSPVLDIGCGNGLFATYCFKDKIDVGLDYDEVAVKEAEKRGIYKEVELADARELPFKDHTFQTVVSICAIEHIPELDKVLSGIYRVLAEGARFIFTVPSERFGDFLFGSTLLRILGLKDLSKRYGDGKNRRSGHMHIYNPTEWKRILSEKGFKIERIDYLFPKEAVFLWSFLHSLFFKMLFLPFRLFRGLNIICVGNILKAMLKGLLSGWLDKRSGTYSSGGYLLIIAARP